ncbi:MAG: glycerol-3-phosphate dehydrogenase [Myxococcota bacterium]|jgi:glycerol-3-phosphate dehydrogenase
MARREEMIQGLSEAFDLLIIGGGITGAGAARDAARRGLKVALVDMQDLAYGTSSRSSKLVHGGLRYLSKAEFSLVFESVSERRILMDIAPHLVTPLSFLYPVYKNSKHGVFTINLGMWVYDGLSLFRTPKIHRNVSRQEVAELEPLLDCEGLRGAPLYYDCATNDARLTLETALDAVGHGATVVTYVRAVGLLRDEGGRVTGVRVRDELSGREQEVRASAVINATGPWSDRTRAMSGGDFSTRLRPTKGVHVVVSASRLTVNNAVVCFHPDDGRVLFAIPWGEETYIGTTDTDFQGDPAEVAATGADVRYLLDAINTYFPDVALTPADVISTWAGIRPLISAESSEHASAVSREHEILIDPDGLITIAGGKLTTYRRMAAEVVDHAVNLLRLLGVVDGALRPAATNTEPLPGAIGWPEDDDIAAVARQVRKRGGQALSEETARYLANTYGMRALDIAALVAADPMLGERLIRGRPEILAQVDYAVTRELAATMRDILIRRTQLFFRDLDQGLPACERIAQRMGTLLGWDEPRQTMEILAYQEEVARSRRWQEDR